MAFRSPFAIPRRLLTSAATSGVRPFPRTCVAYNKTQRFNLATVVPPVTQDATGSKGPTAMVFMNMGGPSTTDEVEDFLSRLFVCSHGIGCRYSVATTFSYLHQLTVYSLAPRRPMAISFLSDGFNHTSDPSLLVDAPQKSKSSTRTSGADLPFESGLNINVPRCANCWIRFPRRPRRISLTSHSVTLLP